MAISTALELDSSEANRHALGIAYGATAEDVDLSVSSTSKSWLASARCRLVDDDLHLPQS